jgi:hypothetical protein
MHTSTLSLLSNVDLGHPYDHALLELVQEMLNGRAAVAGPEQIREPYRTWFQDDATAVVTRAHGTPPLLEQFSEACIRLMIEHWELQVLVLILDLKLSRFATLTQRAFPGACETLFESLGVTTHHELFPTEVGGPKRP